MSVLVSVGLLYWDNRRHILTARDFRMRRKWLDLTCCDVLGREAENGLKGRRVTNVCALSRPDRTRGRSAPHKTVTHDIGKSETNQYLAFLLLPWPQGDLPIDRMKRLPRISLIGWAFALASHLQGNL